MGREVVREHASYSADYGLEEEQIKENVREGAAGHACRDGTRRLPVVQPTEVTVSYAPALIKAIGIATATAEDQGKPKGFEENVGESWSESQGWLIPVGGARLDAPVKPKQNIDKIAPLLPSKYSPIRADDDGNERCYLASISAELGRLISNLVERENPGPIDLAEDLDAQIASDREVREIRASKRAPTEKEQLVRARQGQEIFRQRVIAQEKRGRITNVSDERFRIASHIKPWKQSDVRERLDGENG